MDFSPNFFPSGIEIPSNIEVIFVADLFVEDYVGGAELTTQSLIESSPRNVFKLKSSAVSLCLLEANKDKIWVFGNFSQVKHDLLSVIASSLDYVVLEYDYKYCQARSPERHREVTGQPCDCHHSPHGKIVSTFLSRARCLFWMSEKQKDFYETLFPSLQGKDDSVVLSSVFSHQTISRIKELRERNSNTERKKWIVLGSTSWIKGFEDAERWCKETHKDYEVIWNKPYDKVLEKLASAEGHVYLPKGMDTCPRLTIEAKLLGCQLHLNESVQHRDEDWFVTPDLETTEDYLLSAPQVFWRAVTMKKHPSISGYTTTYDCVRQSYPFKECIQSMLGFCDEVCVVDGGSTDGTWEDLSDLAKRDSKLKIKQIIRDWNSKRSAVFDGMQKAESRAMCTKEFCVQLDADEVIHEDDYEKYLKLANSMTKDVDVVALPVIEFWGSTDKVRLDVNPAKWRLTRNKPHITHGIPKEHRRFDSEGSLYSAGSDGCDLIHRETFEPISFVTFYNHQMHNGRCAALNKDPAALKWYQETWNSLVEQVPCVYHYAWIDIERKIKLYRDFWTRHWQVLFSAEGYVDSSETNMFFDCPWSKVTDQMIKDRAKELSKECGGHVFHTKWDKTKLTPWIECKRRQPKLMING